MPYNIETNCPKCGKKAKGISEIEEIFGFRIVNGKKNTPILL